MIHSSGEVLDIFTEEKKKKLKGPKQQIGIQQFKKKGKKSGRRNNIYIFLNGKEQISLGKSCHLMGLDNDVGRGRDEENVQNAK